MPEIQTNILPLLAIMAVIAVLLIFYVVASILAFRKVNRLRLEAGRNLILQEERIKKNIAAELHDEFSSSLATVTVNLQNIETTDAGILEKLEKAEEAVAALSPKIKHLSSSLMPVQLSKFGLGTVIRDMVEKSSGIAATVSIPKLPLQPDTSLQVFRIVQEIFTNTLKHARATQCAISMRRQQQHLVIDYTDNGVGFDSRSIYRKSGGHGLYNIRSRIEILHGHFKLHTAPGDGVHYTIHIPLHGRAEN